MNDDTYGFPGRRWERSREYRVEGERAKRRMTKERIVWWIAWIGDLAFRFFAFWKRH